MTTWLLRAARAIRFACWNRRAWPTRLLIAPTAYYDSPSFAGEMSADRVAVSGRHLSKTRSADRPSRKPSYLPLQHWNEAQNEDDRKPSPRRRTAHHGASR